MIVETDGSFAALVARSLGPEQRSAHWARALVTLLVLRPLVSLRTLHTFTASFHLNILQLRIWTLVICCACTTYLATYGTILLNTTLGTLLL